MEIIVDEIFFKDLDKLKNKPLYAKIDKVIEEIKAASELNGIKNLKKLSAGKIKDCYRLRIGDYRIGIRLIESRIVFVRILHRKEIYRFFP
ncbi:MAG: type II toxin-antitoxin system RelE/ParE family toxin [Ginsengibacter sp.]